MSSEFDSEWFKEWLKLARKDYQGQKEPSTAYYDYVVSKIAKRYAPLETEASDQNRMGCEFSANRQN